MTDIYFQLVKKYGLSPSQKKIIEIAGNNKTILEAGSSYGYLTKEFKNNGCVVDIIEKTPEAAKAAKVHARLVFLGSVEDQNILKKIKRPYDLVIFADVLEHLVSPEIPLKYIPKLLKKEGKVIISLPNIASWPMRKELFFQGKFEYAESGLLDKTHLRFFSFNSFKKFLKDNGVKIEKIIPTEIYLPFQRTLTRLPVIGSFIAKIYRLIADIVPNLAYYHYIVVGKFHD